MVPLKMMHLLLLIGAVSALLIINACSRKESAADQEVDLPYPEK